MDRSNQGGREILSFSYKLAVVPAKRTTAYKYLRAVRPSRGADEDVALTTILSAVIPGRRASVEPGIHNPRLWLWIPGLRLSAHPGMTAERVRSSRRCAHR